MSQKAEEIEDSQEGILETDENEVQIYYEPEEIEMSRVNQNRDQFAELLLMRVQAAEPLRSKFNIIDFIPKQETEEKPKRSKQKSGTKKSVMRDFSDQELQLSDDEDELVEPVIDYEELKR